MFAPHQERVLTEKHELDEKRRALGYFIERNEVFAKLPKDEQKRLERQRKAMQEYSDVLGERISHFSDETA